MKIHLVKKVTIENYYRVHQGSSQAFITWLKTLKRADWNNPGDIKTTFATAVLLGKSSLRVVFDIGGGNYRMICQYGFGKNEVHLFVKWIGSHSEYDKINKMGLQYTINMF